MKRPMSHGQRFSLNLAAFSVFLIALGALGGLLKSCEGHSEEWAASQSLVDSQIASQQDYRKQKASQDLCLATIGESSAAWTTDGELVCTPRKGKK